MPAKRKTKAANIIGAAYGRTYVSRGPKVTPTGTTIRVANREYWDDAGSASTAGARTRGIKSFQPQGSGTWLSAIASAYTYYRVHKLKFHYVPAAGTDVNGFVELAFFYDNEDATTWYNGTGAQLSQNKHYLTCPPWGGASNSTDGGHCLTVDVNNPHLPWFRVDASAADYAQASLNSIGTLAISVVSSATNYLCGRVFVEYDVEFKEPVAPSTNS